MTSFRKGFPIKEDLKKMREEIIHEFHVFYERFTDQVKLIAGLQLEIIRHLD
jgi:hypothetical protein